MGLQEARRREEDEQRRREDEQRRREEEERVFHVLYCTYGAGSM